MKAERFHVAEDYIDMCLEDWARLMRTDEPVKGFPRAVPGLSNGGTSKTFEDMCDECDFRIAKTTKAIVEDLAASEQCALHNAYGLASVWRFNREPYSVVLERAKQNVGIGLRKRGVWLGE